MAGVRAGRTWWVVAGAVAAAVVVVAFALLAGSQPYRAVGDADPGALVRLGTPVLRLVTDLAAVVCTGCLAFVAWCTRPQPSGAVAADGYAQLCVAARAAAVWCAGALLMVPFSAGDATGTPLGEVLVPEHLLGLFAALEQPSAWLMTAGAALVIAVGSRVALRWHSAVGLSVLAVFALLPPLVTAHGSSDAGHDLAIPAILIHVPAAVLWLGVLVALLGHARRHGTVGLALATRYARLATACLLILVASGLVLAGVLVPPGELVSSGYGTALLVKAVVVAVLGLGGVLLRRRALRALPARSTGANPLLRLVTAELFVLLGVLGISVGLTHLPVPDFLGRVLGTQEILLGYRLSGPPTPLRLLTDWRIEVLFGSLAVLLAAGYLLGVRRLARRGRPWPPGRTVSWLAGCVVLALATSSGIGRYGAAMFSMHMAGHMLISMLVPVLLALGAPLTLIGAAARPAGAGLPAAPEWLGVLRESRLMRVLTHPAAALALFAGSPFALYFTGLFDALVRFHWGHLAINAWFLVVGYLFAWLVVGVDPAPRPLPNLARLGLLLAAMPADIVFGALVIGTGRVLGNGPAAADMYQALALPWVPDLLADQRLGGILALVLGELVLFAMMAVLLARWTRLDDVPDGAGQGGYRTALTGLSAR